MCRLDGEVHIVAVEDGRWIMRDKTAATFAPLGGDEWVVDDVRQLVNRACPATALRRNVAGSLPTASKNGAFEAGSGGPLGPPSPPPLLFPFDWLESLLPAAGIHQATKITIKQNCRKHFMAGPREAARCARRDSSTLK